MKHEISDETVSPRDWHAGWQLLTGIFGFLDDWHGAETLPPRPTAR